MKEFNYRFNHKESKTLLFLADNSIDIGYNVDFFKTDIIETVIENTLDENGNFGEDVELEIIVKVKRK